MRVLALAAQISGVQVFLRRCELKDLFYRLTEAVELLLRVVCQDQVPDKGQQAVHSGALL